MREIVGGETFPDADLMDFLRTIARGEQTFIGLYLRQGGTSNTQPPHPIDPFLMAGRVARIVVTRAWSPSLRRDAYTWRVVITNQEFELANGDVLRVYGQGDNVDIFLNFVGLNGTLSAGMKVSEAEVQEALQSIASAFPKEDA